MQSDLLEHLANKSLSKQELLEQAKKDATVRSMVLQGINSPRAAIRYGCAKVLMDLSEEDPELLYPSMKVFIDLLDSKYRILVWNALTILANLTRVDDAKQFDVIVDRYYSLIQNDYLVTVANVVGNSSTIALAKPYLIPQIVDHLLTVDELSTTPHLTEECKRVLAQHVIKAMDAFFDHIEDKERVIAFVKRHRNSSRAKLRTSAQKFLEKWAKLA
jgi:hypothetical protein